MKQKLPSFIFLMPKWFIYIALILICCPFFLSAKTKNTHLYVISDSLQVSRAVEEFQSDTTRNSKKDDEDDKKKIKEVAPAKKQPKPEKLGHADAKSAGKKTVPKDKRKRRERRPQGMERPPEIPRRSGN